MRSSPSDLRLFTHAHCPSVTFASMGSVACTMYGSGVSWPMAVAMSTLLYLLRVSTNLVRLSETNVLVFERTARHEICAHPGDVVPSPPLLNTPLYAGLLRTTTQTQ